MSISHIKPYPFIIAYLHMYTGYCFTLLVTYDISLILQVRMYLILYIYLILYQINNDLVSGHYTVIWSVSSDR